ncbi:MAG TPA: polysaccharide biosynthesis/export family protein [Pyrinomonadaceae bacterium]|nr:polysaccharide biosynthesis/export family protein [Pyrinomonadaceae bacterium]
MFKSLAFFIVAVLSAPYAGPVSAQTANYLDDPRSSTRIASTEEKAEAKRLYKQGVKYGLAGLYLQAAQMFEQAVKLDPQYADAHFALGHAYFDLQQWKNAIRGFERAYELNPKDDQARDMLALSRTLAHQGPPSAYTPREQSPPKAESVQVSMTVKQPPAPAKIETPVNSNEGDKANAAANEVALTKIYRVGPNDVLDIRINDSSSQSTLFTVTHSGTLEHPLLVEPLHVAGLTVDEIGARLQNELKRRALVENPKVSVGVRDYASHTILVSGLVKDSGTKILRREAIPLYVVIADAQPLPEAARVTVVRNESNQTFEIDLAHATEMNLLVRPGDVITVLPNVTQFVYIGGEVKSPGEKVYRRGLTLTQAIIAAGGITPKAKEARLGRDDGKGFLVVTRYKLKEIESGKVQDPLVKPGDRITIRD